MFRPKRKPRRGGSVLSQNITELELAEYRQNGMIRIKPVPVMPEDRRRWPYGCYRSIDIQGILGGTKLWTWDPELELTVLEKVMMTDYGIVAVEDLGSRYRLEVADKSQRRRVLSDLDWNGCRARITNGGFITVFKEELVYD